jgi:hypothetical protein
MIKLADGEFDPKKALEKYQAGSIEYDVLNKMIKSDMNIRIPRRMSSTSRSACEKA